MPEISRFFGIVIQMYFNEHNSPHFHFKYSNQKAQIEIETLKLTEGFLPPKALSLIIEWASINQNELHKNWLDLIQSDRFTKTIHWGNNELRSRRLLC